MVSFCRLIVYASTATVWSRANASVRASVLWSWTRVLEHRRQGPRQRRLKTTYRRVRLRPKASVRRRRRQRRRYLVRWAIRVRACSCSNSSRWPRVWPSSAANWRRSATASASPTASGASARRTRTRPSTRPSARSRPSATPASCTGRRPTAMTSSCRPPIPIIPSTLKVFLDYISKV